MIKQRKVSGSIADPTLPKTPIQINGVPYNLCFDLGALAEAEASLNAEGHQVNLLAALPVLNLSHVRLIFAAALHKFHPEISFDQASNMVTLANVFAIANTIAEAWKAALPEHEKTGEEKPAA
jgi:hypothetical protein